MIARFAITHNEHNVGINGARKLGGEMRGEAGHGS